MNYRIDYVLSKVAFNAGYTILAITGLGSKVDRTGKMRKTKARFKAKNKQKVIETYYQIDPSARERYKPHRIATIIRESMERKYGNAPSTATIKNYLKEEGKF